MTNDNVNELFFSIFNNLSFGIKKPTVAVTELVRNMGDINYLEDELDYVQKKIGLARLEMSEISPIVQSLSIEEDQEDLHLLQMNNCVLREIQEGQLLTIRGDPSETAVICTDTCTFELKEAETSNSLLLLPKLHFPNTDEKGNLLLVPRAVCGIFHTYLELRNFRPSFKKLRSILGENTYKGKEYENSEIKNFTFDDLLDVIQASRVELQKALEDLQTCIVGQEVRILDFDYKFNILSQIIHVIESKSIPLDRIPKDDVLESLRDDIQGDVLEKCFGWYTRETDGNVTKLYALDEDAVCQAYAEFLLHAAGKFHLAEFLESWQKSVPEGMQCSLSQLHGLALVDRNYRPEIIFYFPAHDLPENLVDRFNKLFKAKEKWAYDEIVPYLLDKAVTDNDVKSLLIKYARESMKNGLKLYTAKW